MSSDAAGEDNLIDLDEKQAHVSAASPSSDVKDLSSEKDPVSLTHGGDPAAPKAEAVVSATEVQVSSEGAHSPSDLDRSLTPLDTSAAVEVDTSAEKELQGILSQQLPPTPGAHSMHSRRQSYSFSRKPTPEPEDIPFDFTRFQEQLKAKTAEPVAKYMRSFLFEFKKRQWTNTEQQKIIADFLEFIRGKMMVYEPFKSASEQEFNNANEGMEKLIVNRLYAELFPPLIAAKIGKSEADRLGHGEDLDRDRILMSKIRTYSWVREEHLDIPAPPDADDKRANLHERFIGLAAIEVLKLDQYRAPRDKIICILNCCKVIFGLLKHAGKDASADRFIPFLILTLLHANVPNLVSHVNFIQRFRHPDKLNGEVEYYLSSLFGAISFIEELDKASLTITDEEFDRKVEEAVKRIRLEDATVPPSPITPAPKAVQPGTSFNFGFASPPTSRPDSAQGLGARRASNGPGRLQLPTKDLVFEKAGELLNIAKPSLSTIGRLFSQDSQGQASTTTPAEEAAEERQLQEGLRRSMMSEEEQAVQEQALRLRRERKLAKRQPRKSGQSRSYIEDGAFGGSLAPSPQLDDSGASGARSLPRRRASERDLIQFEEQDEDDTRPQLPLRRSGMPETVNNQGTSTQATALSTDSVATPTPVPEARQTLAEARSIADKERQETLATLSAMFEQIDVGVIEMVLEAKGNKVGGAIDALLEMSG
jgi:hypothetical protein